MTVDHRTVQVNDITMAVQVAGPDRPRATVVLLHGFPGLGYSWRHQLEPLAQAGFRVLAPDLRGYGGTTAPASVSAYDRESTVADLVGLLDAFEVEQAVFSGHDFGAALAWDLPLWAPDRVRALAQLSVPRNQPSATRPAGDSPGWPSSTSCTSTISPSRDSPRPSWIPGPRSSCGACSGR